MGLGLGSGFGFGFGFGFGLAARLDEGEVSREEECDGLSRGGLTSREAWVGEVRGQRLEVRG